VRKQGPLNFVTYLPQELRIPLTNNEQISVLDLALRAHIPLEHSCGGMGSCTTCRVIVESDVTLLSPRNEVESERAEERDFAENERLSCQLLAHAGLRVRIP
jgi:2Fe-2S ferredoxin